MEAPVCRICGEKHWSRVCDGDESVTKNVTSRDTVTASVTPKQADLETENRALRAEVERLTGEVAYLKMLLAGKPGAVARTDEPQTVGTTASVHRPMTAAEHKRNQRAKAKQVV